MPGLGSDRKPMTDDQVSVSPEPRVTIAVPCFKQEVFLFECLNSLIAQTMPLWQALVVDDCSPARSVDRIVDSYHDSRIRSMRHDSNRGPAAAKNTALQAGDAPFVLYVDADDFLHPEFLSATLEAIERQGTDCAYTAFQCVGLSTDVRFTHMLCFLRVRRRCRPTSTWRRTV
jgi:glycosyltransferase involved in cell wall biosynthesis